MFREQGKEPRQLRFPPLDLAHDDPHVAHMPCRRKYLILHTLDIKLDEVHTADIGQDVIQRLDARSDPVDTERTGRATQGSHVKLDHQARTRKLGGDAKDQEYEDHAGLSQEMNYFYRVSLDQAS